MATAAQVDLEIDQGADFGAQVYWTDGDSNPFTVLAPMTMDIRSLAGNKVYSLSVSDQVNHTIIYNSTAGLIQLYIPAADTAKFAAGSYVYDLWVTYVDNNQTSTNRLHKLLTGNIFVNGRVTQSVQ